MVGYIEPSDAAEFEFVDDTKGGVIPKQFMPAVEAGFRSMLEKGELLGVPVVNVRVVVNDGNAHSVDSSEVAFKEAARGAWRQCYRKAHPRILEPMMRTVVEAPTEFGGGVLGTLTQRRGMIIGSQETGNIARIESEVPLAEMFGYATVLRSSTQGKAEFTMEFSRYLEVPTQIGEALLKARADSQKKRA